MRHALLFLLLAAFTTVSTASAAVPMDGSATPAEELSAEMFAPVAEDDVTETGEPDGFVLSSAYPNPFNPQTSFSLEVDERQQVRVEVFNLLGRSVSVLFDGMMDADVTRSFTFDAGDLPSGIYLYRVRGENFTATRQMTLLK